MSCTAEEIAEKRRIAIERLNARKNGLNNNVGGGGGPSLVSSSVAETTSTQHAAETHKRPWPSGTHNPGSFYGTNSTVSNFKQIVTNGAKPAEGGGKMKNFFNNPRSQTLPYVKNTPIGNGTPDKVAPVFTRTVTCSCALVAESRFVVQPSGFHERLIEVFKSVPSKQYGEFDSFVCPDISLWVCPAFHPWIIPADL